MALSFKRNWPVLVVLLVSLAFIGWRLNSYDWQADRLAEVGTQFAEGDPAGTEGYDGQFVLFMAQELRPGQVKAKLDVPAYRYQRILLPLVARLLALGQEGLVPWMLLLVNFAAHGLGVWGLCRLLEHYGQWPGFALHYGLWVGLIVGVGAVLHEPLAYGLITVAWWFRTRKKRGLAIALLGLSLFAKETGLVFLLAFLLADFFEQKLRSVAYWYAIVAVAFGLWQAWLWSTFGQPGIGSGGAGASSFELIPFMGFLRIATVDLSVFLLFLVLFGPGILVPTIWGGVRSGLQLVSDQGQLAAWALFLSAVVIMVLPFSTFREPLGLVRLASGLVLAVLVYAAKHNYRRPLVYGLFWLAYWPLIL